MALFRKKEKPKNWKARNPRMYSGVPKRDNREKRGRFSRFLFWVLFFGFLGVCGYILFFSPFLEIESVGIEGNSDISSEEIAGKVNGALDGKYFNLFSKRNFFLASRRAMSESLKNGFSRLEVSSVEKKFPRAILVKVKERQPEMAWCSSGVCYLVDKDGFVYAGANATDEELGKDRFLIVIDDSARPVDIKKTTVNPDFMHYVKSADAMLVSGLGFQIEGNYHTPALSSQEISVRIVEEGNEGWTLKLNQSVSIEDTKKTIQTVFDKELEGEKRKSLEYLDLRVKNKVYYKLRS
jgi:cell division septal protein FtsQ